MSVYMAEAQSVSLITADSWGEPWERKDLQDLMASTEDLTDLELAVIFGRSLYAIQSIQHRVRVEGLETIIESEHRRRVAAERREVRLCNRHFVALSVTGDCGLC